MVYKRYIKKKVNGRTILCGPYYYESRKENGKVISTYLGTKRPKSYKRNLIKNFPNKYLIFAGVLLLVLITFVNLVILLKPVTTGEITVILEEKVYQQGEQLRGNVVLTLKQGELIPADTIVLVNNVGDISEFLLSDLLTEPTIQGDFFVAGTTISGTGQGYGVAGEKTIYPEVQFTMEIEKLIINPLGSENKENITYEGLEETQSETTFLPMKESYYEVNGTVSYGNPFIHRLKEGEVARIIWSSQPVILSQSPKSVTITTEYSEIEQGFGQDYLLNETADFKTDLTSLNLLAKQGLLIINFSYNNTILAFLSESIIVETNQSEPNISTTQENASIDTPVKWKKNIKLHNPGTVRVKVPKVSSDIKVFKSGIEISFTTENQTNFTEIIIDDDGLEYDVEYNTPAPIVVEEELPNKKRLKVSSPEEVHYQDVLIYTNIPESLNIRDSDKVKIKWIEQDTFITPTLIQDTDTNQIYDYIEFIAPQLSNQTFEIFIEVLNIQSYPTVGGNWTVAFNTSGTADLTIRAINATTWSDTTETEDLKFLEIKCGDVVQSYQWIADSVFIQDYNCDGQTGFETSKVLTEGAHSLEFEFGTQKAYANNYAGQLTMDWGVVNNVGTSWVTVNLVHDYATPVIVATYNLPSASDPPAVARITNVGTNSFDVRIQNPGDLTTPTPGDVHYIVIEEGDWTLPGGASIEAYTYTSTTTSEKSNRNKDPQRTYTNSYTNPVVLGQVMSFNDPLWSAFWCTADSGTGAANPPSATSLYTGKEVGEDTVIARNDEVVGYIVIEQGSGDIDGIEYRAELGPDSLNGVGNAPPYFYSFSSAFSTIPKVAILSQAAMDGNNGGWAVLFGASPLTTTQVGLAIDEDIIADTERAHTTEQAGYLIFEIAGSYPSNSPPDTPQDIECDGVPGAGSCDITINSEVILEATGSTDVDPITYYLEAELDNFIDSGDQEPGTQQLIASGGGTTLGETGEVVFPNGDGSTHSISFQNTYNSAPIVVAAPVTENSVNENYINRVITSVTTTGFDIRLCIDAGTSDCTPPEADETIHYFVFDVDEVNTYPWIAVGTQIGVTTNAADTAISFGKTFSNAPLVWVQSQTYNQAGNQMAASAWVDDITTTGANIQGCTHQGISNTCDSATPSETFAWVAIDIASAGFDSALNFQAGTTSVNGPTWSTITWNPTYTDARIMVTINDDSGGQDPKFPWARDIDTTTPDVKQCEQDGFNDCDNHNTNPAAWFTMEQGSMTVGGGTPDNEATTNWQIYNDVFSSSNININEIQVEVIVSNYDNSGSTVAVNNMPDLELEIWDSIQFVNIGTFSVNSAGTYSLIITNPTILTAWETTTNTDLRIRGIDFDYFDALNFDQINFNSVIITINNKQWTSIGSHLEGSTFNWDIDNPIVVPDQQDVNLRARAIDLTGSNFYSNYFTKNPTSPYLEISRGANTPPTIDQPSASIANQNPTDGGTGITQVAFTVEVTDLDGTADIQDATLIAQVTSPDTLVTNIATCINPTPIDTDTKTYDCTINMNYYDEPGDWELYVEIQDLATATGTTTIPAYFLYTLLKSIKMDFPAGALSWPVLNPGDPDVYSDNDPSVIENLGNYEGAILITGYDLIGADATPFPVDNFRAGPVSGSECSATQLQDSNSVSITGSSLARGAGATENIYYCISSVPAIRSQPYSTTNPPSQSWTIII